MLFIFIIITGLAIYLQSRLFIENRNKVNFFKSSLSNLDELNIQQGIVQLKLQTDIEHDIIEETNDFLHLRRNNLLLDFSQLKEKIEKKLQTRIDEIEGTIPLPLYIALMATVSGIVISLFSLFIFNQSEENKANLLVHIATTMIATFTGVGFYFWQSKEFNQTLTDFENRLNKYWKKIENAYNLSSSSSFVQSIELLQKNLNHFNERFEDTLINFNQGFVSTVKDLGAAIEGNIQATSELNQVVTKIQKINLEKVIKGNYRILEKTEDIVEKLKGFEVWFENMQLILASADKMTQTLNQAIERTNNLELAVNNFNQATTFHTDIAKFLKEHLTKLEDYKQYAEETANKSFTQFKYQLQQTNADLLEKFKELEENLFQIQKSFANELAKQLHDTFSTTKIEEFQNKNDEFVKKYGKIVEDISERFENLVEKTRGNIDEIIKNFGRGSDEISSGFNNISQEIQNLQKSITEFEEISQINKNLSDINQNVAILSGNTDNGWTTKLEILNQLEKLDPIHTQLQEHKTEFEKFTSILSKLEEVQKQNLQLLEENQKYLQKLTSEQPQTAFPVSKTANLKLLEGNFTVSEKNTTPVQDSHEVSAPENVPNIQSQKQATATQTKIQLGILIILFLILLVLGFWAFQSIYKKPVNTLPESSGTSTLNSNIPDSLFTFQAETQNKPDNFNTKIKITKENLQRLYKNYSIEELWNSQDLTLYKAFTRNPQPQERYFTRLILMKNNEQIAEKLFYDLQLDFFIPREKDFLLGFNSPQNQVLKTCNCAKIIAVNYELEPFFERSFKYDTFPFTNLKSLKLNENGFEAEIVNLNLSDKNKFDEYSAKFDSFGNIYKSNKNEVRN